MWFQANKSQAARRPRIYTAPPDRPFLTVVAETLLAGNLPVAGGPRPNPLDLADITLMLPTRRDMRTLQEAFLKASGGAALLLPKIKLISDEGDDLALLVGADGADEREPASAKPAISKLERELTLTRLVLRWSEATGTRTPAQAVRLAQELARLMDEVEIEDVRLDNLASLVRDDLSAHWAHTLEFLEIVTRHWPDHLAEHGLVSRAERRQQLMLAEAARLQREPPAAPVIVAGVTGTVPAATALMRVVAALPNGALVLPALDRTLDEESWDAITPAHPEHPQFGLKKVLDALAVKRTDVDTLPGTAESRTLCTRWALACEAMRPARTTERWHHFTAAADRKDVAAALAGLTILEAPNAEEEAESIALILREATEAPGRTAALVSPDRQLARRVSTRLESWGLRVVDAAGQPFAHTPCGAFLDLVIEAAARKFEPVAVAALLKHPFCRLGMAAGEFARGRRTLELAAFRAPYLGQGLEGVVSALERAEAENRSGARRQRAVRRLGPADWKAARDLVRLFGKAFRPLEKLFGEHRKVSLRTLAKAHTEAAEALAATGRKGEVPVLWQAEAGQAASTFLASLLDAHATTLDLQPADYPEFYRGLIAGQTVQARGPAHPRIFIWGPLEARLQQPDVVVLGSLNEGTWPQAADPGPWLNRPMRQALGLPAPEERIGQAAHDFTSLLGAERVCLTRAAKIGGVPTVPSRWLLRLQALLAGLGHVPAAGNPWLEWAQMRNAIDGPPQPVRAPEPCPPLAQRPRQLSVTAIEKWMANPYALFAQRILGLESLTPLGQPPDAALRGQIVHATLSRFAQRFPDRLPDDIHAQLAAIAEATLADYTGSPRVAAFWAPRLARFAAWFAETEPGRRDGITKSLTEVDGAVVLEGPAGPFTLKARADRIDVGKGGLVITDYKTGANLSTLATRAKDGKAPQLPLEATIAMAGGFTGLASTRVVTGLRYISASGGEPPGQDVPLKVGDVAVLARAARDGLERLIAAFDRETTPYRALRRAGFNYVYDDYAHLARVAEWSIETVEEEA